MPYGMWPFIRRRAAEGKSTYYKTDRCSAQLVAARNASPEAAIVRAEWQLSVFLPFASSVCRGTVGLNKLPQVVLCARFLVSSLLLLIFVKQQEHCMKERNLFAPPFVILGVYAGVLQAGKYKSLC